jgi:hypothetical protein
LDQIAAIVQGGICVPQSGTLTQVLRRRPAPTSVKTCVRSRMSFFGDRKPLSVIARGSQGPPRGGRTVWPPMYVCEGEVEGACEV